MGATAKTKFDLTSGDNGYFCVSGDGHQLIQGTAHREGVEVWVGCDQPVTVEKMFGPLAFVSIRVRADFETCEWIVERDCGPEGEWREVARVAGQTPEDFPE